MKRIIAALALLALSTGAFAAPFCVVASYGMSCFYYDYPTCQRAAHQQRGACVVNPNP